MDNTKIIVGNRFDTLVKTLNHSIPSFAKALGYERCDKLYNIQKGKYYPSFEILQDITKFFVAVNTDWIISGRGSMFRDSKIPEENTMGVTSNTTPISPAEESIIYKMYKDEKEDWKAEKEKKEAQIDHLQSELRSMEKELATYRAKYSPSNDIPLAFTPGSSEGYTPSSDTTIKPPKSSKRSSAGKT